MRVVTSEWDVLVVDLDGTLLCTQGEVSEQNLHALDEVRDCGVEIVVATGRCFAECRHIVERINHHGVCITAGGSKLTDYSGKILARSVIDQSISNEVSTKILKNNLRCLLLKDSTECETQYVLVGESPLHQASEWWFDSLGISVLEVSAIDDDPWPEHTLRVGAVAEEKNLQPIVTELEIALKGKAKFQHWSAVTSSHATGSSIHLLEVFGYTVNKWSMLEKHLDGTLQHKRIAAIGDGLNDIELLKEAGLSIAMENASDAVQEHADVIAGHHDEHGFAHAMQRWILPRLELEQS
jgi:hypothetical protein